MSDRAAIFEREITEYDERQLPKVLDFEQHRFVSIERDSVTGGTYVRGHKSLRGACSYLANVLAGAERFVPERVLDLDTGDLHELDVFAFVAPRNLDAVAVMMPRTVAEVVLAEVSHHEPAYRLMKQAMERRS